MKKEEELIKKIARLESINDQLVAEIRFLDTITKKLGFSEGLKTLKSAAIELLEMEENENFSEDSSQDSFES